VFLVGFQEGLGLLFSTLPGQIFFAFDDFFEDVLGFPLSHMFFSKSAGRPFDNPFFCRRFFFTVGRR